MSHKIESLRKKLADIVEETQVIEADAGGRDYTPVQIADIGKLSAQFDEVEAQIAAASMIERASEPLPSKTQTAPSPVRGATTISRGPSNGTGGFSSFGGFLAAVRGAASGQTDGRLMNAITTYGNEGAGVDGGFAVPPSWQKEIMEIVAGPGTLIDALTPIPCPTNMITLPVDENSAHSSTGITAAWTGEAATITASKPVLKQVNINLWKVAGLVHLSDELVEDNAVTGQYALRILAKKIKNLVEAAIVAGDGVAKPLGFLNAPALVTVANAGSSAVMTASDPLNMVSRLLAGSFENAFWVCHSSVLPYVWALTLGQQPVVVQDATQSPYGTLLGRPIFVSEHCKDYNTVGDFFLVSPDGYGLAMKSSGLRTDTSIHFGFDAGLQSFRATLRVGGTPLLSAAVARANGSATQSHIVCLGVRS
jgi:HK97 family phage major capsid protein